MRFFLILIGLGLIAFSVVVQLSMMDNFFEDMMWQYLPEDWAVYLLKNKMASHIATFSYWVLVSPWVFGKTKRKKLVLDNVLIIQAVKSTQTPHLSLFTVSDSALVTSAFNTSPRLKLLAERVSFRALSKASVNNSHQYLWQTSPSRLRTRKSLEIYLISLVLSALSVLFLFAFVLSVIGDFVWKDLYLLLIAGILAVLSFAIVSEPKPRIFDKNLPSENTSGWFWCGSAWLKDTDAIAARVASCAIDNIIAVQVLGEHIVTHDDDYHHLELNVVQKNGKRHNVMTHFDEHDLMKDAICLAKFLNVPIFQ